MSFDAIVLAGGGLKGFVTLGALHYYHEHGLYLPEQVKEYAGTSMGAAICLLLICGYTPKEIFTEFYKIENFFDSSHVDDIWGIVKNMGLMSVNQISSILETLVYKKMECIPTLEKLRMMTGKSLFICGSNISRFTEEKYSPDTHPNLSCINAVKMSCNLPLIFQQLIYKGSYTVDGGLVNNYPWDYISSERKNILGVVTKEKIKYDTELTKIEYIFRLVMLPISHMTARKCCSAPEKVTTVKAICESTPIIKSSLSDDKKMELFTSGYHSGEIRHNTKNIIVKGWGESDNGWEWDDTVFDENN